MNEVDELIDQACGGNEAAVAELFVRFRPQLKRLVLMRMHPRLGTRLDASDVLQETYLELARRLPEYAKERKIPFFLWLRLLTGQRLNQMQRMHLGAEKRTVYRELGLASFPEIDASDFNLASQLAGHFTSVDRTLIREEVQVKLMHAVQGLDANDRELLEMRHFEELSTPEIAAVLGLTRSGVLKRYTRAIRRLQQAVFGDSDLQVE